MFNLKFSVAKVFEYFSFGVVGLESISSKLVSPVNYLGAK